MNREIKFRGKVFLKEEWVYGDLVKIKNLVAIKKTNGDYFHPTQVSPNTVGQYTGLKDKNGKEIYEGDIIEYHDTPSYCINPDCDNHLLGYSSYISKEQEKVVFEDGTFGVYKNESYPIMSLIDCGIYKEYLDDIKERVETDSYFDTKGYKVDDSIVGVKVIGNIHDNPELLKQQRQ